MEVSEEHIRRERQKARELRASYWWKRKRSTGIFHHWGGKVAPAELTMNHLVPVIRGGKSAKGNLGPFRPTDSAGDPNPQKGRF